MKSVCVCVKINSLASPRLGYREKWTRDTVHTAKANNQPRRGRGCDFVHFHENYSMRVCKRSWRTMQRETECIALCQWKTTSTNKKTSSPRTLSGSRASTALSCWDSNVGTFQLDSRDDTLQHQVQDQVGREANFQKFKKFFSCVF